MAFEVDLETLCSAARRDRSFRTLSPFPPSTIDLAFVVRDDVPAAALARTLRDAAGAVLETVRPFDEYRGEQLGEGRKSLAFMLVFRAPDHTLTDAAAHDATLRE